jgi:hypothetical protein
MNYVTTGEVKSFLARWPDDTEVGLTCEDELCVIKDDAIVGKLNLLDSSRPEVDDETEKT